LSEADAALAMEDVLSMPVEYFGFEPLGRRVWELRGSVTAYDAWYIALAEALDAPLATIDRRLASSNGGRCQFVLPPS
jgi:predicted nucleic acid-binding protein